MSDVDADREAILHVHNEWWESNHEIDIPRMRECFAGERFHMFNLNGHPYMGLEELTDLWRELNKQRMTIPRIEQPIRLRLDIHGNVAWLAHEGLIHVNAPHPLQNIPTDFARVRSTEVYEKNEAGEWKIVHFHCSPHAPDDEPRLPFGDTVISREAAE
jgi:ketosteroid isomerase-like protein